MCKDVLMRHNHAMNINRHIHSFIFIVNVFDSEHFEYKAMTDHIIHENESVNYINPKHVIMIFNVSEFCEYSIWCVKIFFLYISVY